MNRIHSQWLELKTQFQVSRNNEKCYTADQLYKLVCDDFNYAYVCFLKPILADVNRVNKSFDANNIDPSKLLDDLVKLVNSFESKITKPNTNLLILEHSS